MNGANAPQAPKLAHLFQSAIISDEMIHSNMIYWPPEKKLAFASCSIQKTHVHKSHSIESRYDDDDNSKTSHIKSGNEHIYGDFFMLKFTIKICLCIKASKGMNINIFTLTHIRLTQFQKEIK